MGGDRFSLRDMGSDVGFWLFNQFYMQCIADQPLVVDISAQSLAEVGATEEQVLNNLSLVGRHFFAHMKADTGVIG